MVNEHYVQQSYLRLFAPDGEGVISRYSLVDKHEGGDYYDPIDEYSIRQAASAENYAGGVLEDAETTRAENAIVGALGRVDNDRELSEEDIAHLSQFVTFQRDRSPRAKIYHTLREEISRTAGRDAENLWELTMHVDASERHEGFQFMGWRVIENETNLPFFTSDIPVVFYQDEHPGTGLAEGFEFERKEIYCPISPDKLLLLLDPNTFDVEPQFPETTIDRISIKNENEIWKFNLLQGISAFQEIFGPVGYGDQLERTIKVLCKHFGDEDYIRGARWTIDRIMEAQKSGIRQSSTTTQVREILTDKDKEIVLSYKKASDAIWKYTHQIPSIEELRRDNPISEYWSHVGTGM